eukprot:CAMPEP_0184425582 /NCGR_PEP_ID=MMETSP0738-20130409/135749_1 /TAXON_ID=385413 /ORGANISM="Thalassiosira miniscula, Strain CCMP1093" /LENGTH=35 /DNA_ID= /DNA_START= /DNA_END= /DNA_ORIENTATION=
MAIDTSSQSTSELPIKTNAISGVHWELNVSYMNGS